MSISAPIGQVETDTSDPYPGDMISLHTLKSAAWRRRRFWIALALIGMVAGAGFHLLVPRKYSATADLYLMEPSNSDAQQALATDASLLKTRAVAAQAIAALHLKVTPASFLSSYRSTAVSGVILGVTFTAHTEAESLQRDDAVAKAFLTFRASEFEQQTKTQVSGLQSEIASTQSQMSQLASSIRALSGAAPGTSGSSQLATLTSEQTGDAAQVTQLEGQMQQDQLGVAAIVGGSKVLDPPAAVRVSAKKVIAIDAISGMVGGLGVGLIVVVLGTVLSECVRRRRDVAEALGVPVQLSVGRYRRRTMRRRRLARLMAKPSPALTSVVDRLSSALDASPRSSLATIAVAAGEPAALAVGILARRLAAEGKKVAIADLADGRPAAELFGAGDLVEGTRLIDAHEEGAEAVMVVVAPDKPSWIAVSPELEWADVVLTLATVDPATGTDHLAAWATDAVAVVTAGRATSVRLATTGQLVRQAGFDLKSAILVGADPDDFSLGALRAGPATPDSEGRLAVVLGANE